MLTCGFVSSFRMEMLETPVPECRWPRCGNAVEQSCPLPPVGLGGAGVRSSVAELGRVQMCTGVVSFNMTVAGRTPDVHHRRGPACNPAECRVEGEGQRFYVSWEALVMVLEMVLL